MLDQNIEEILSLFNKYKININEIGVNDEVKLERFGVVIPFSQRRICEERPKKVCAEILKTFIQQPEYKAKTQKYVDGLIKKPIPIYNTSYTPILSVEEKKRLIRNKLTKEGLLS
jgi:uncharacterized protein YlxP (DUF503 family)